MDGELKLLLVFAKSKFLTKIRIDLPSVYYIHGISKFCVSLSCAICHLYRHETYDCALSLSVVNSV